MNKLLGFVLKLFFALTCLTCQFSCITEESFEDSPRGNFEALWSELDKHYCFFEYKNKEFGLDWNNVHAKYSKMINQSMDSRQMFEVLANMTYELRDGHVNLYAAHNVARYGKWFDDYPANYSDSLERIYLGKSNEYQLTSGMSYKILRNNIGYVRCSSFNQAFGDGNLSEIFRYLSSCQGLIVDVRNNGGGMLSSAEKFASCFINEDLVVCYMSHKTGAGHNDFSPPIRVIVKPFSGLRWQKPVAILTNRSTYSAANSFVMFMKGLNLVTIIGDKTGGGAGMPFSSELPCGWAIRFSACPMYDRNMQQTEMGIDPDLKINISQSDYNHGIDSIIEKAIEVLSN